MFISYSQKKGFLYASITTSRRDGAVVTKEYVNLGRVLDKERGIYRNRQKGVFTYDINFSLTSFTGRREEQNYVWITL